MICCNMDIVLGGVGREDGMGEKHVHQQRHLL